MSPTLPLRKSGLSTAVPYRTRAKPDGVGQRCRGYTFQQIQKYESAKNAVAPGRLRQMCEFLGVAPAEMFGKQPKIDGEPIPEMTRWSHRMLIALNKIRSESVRRSLGALIEELMGSQ
jgi:hypothetical protein